MTRVLVGLETCDLPKYQARRDMCLGTWAAKLPEGFDLVVGSGATLKVPDDYYSLPLKTQALCAIALREGFDWLLVVDDDVFIRTDRLKTPYEYRTTGDNLEMLVEARWKKIGDYCGHISGPSGDRPHRYCYGGCYWLSPRAMKVVAEAKVDDRIEDRWVGGVLYAAGILPVELAGYEIGPCLCGICKPVPLSDNWVAAVDLNWPGQFEAIAEMGRVK